MNMENLGNYRFCRQRIGHSGTRIVLSEHKSELECRNACNNTSKVIDWVYYCEQEVIYTGTQLDENKNPIASAPTWIILNN